MYKTQFSYREIATGKTIVEVDAGVDGKSGIDAGAVGENVAQLLSEDGKNVKIISIAVQPVSVAPAVPVRG
jgi:hypothetical protein